MATYTVEQFVNSYYMPIELANIFKLIAHDYEQKHKDINGIITPVTITVTVKSGDGGASWNGVRPNYTVTFFMDSGGSYPVKSIEGKPTFAQYDNMVGPIHEPIHILLNLLGVGTAANDDDEADEINIAVFADAVRAASGDLEKLTGMMKGTEPGWSESDKLTKATSRTASYENTYNNINRNFSSMTGLSKTPDVTRTGYLVDGEWKTSLNTMSDDLRRQSLIVADPGKDVALLGNQLSNRIISGKGNDYIDGGDGNDTLYGEGGALDANQIKIILDDNLLNSSVGGNDTLIGGRGQDTIYGGAGNDNLFGGRSDQGDDGYADTLIGGADFDTYYAGDGDTIKDDIKGEGEVWFEGVKLTGGTSKNACNTSHQYFGDGGIYTFSGGELTFIKDGHKLTIKDFKKTKDGYLSILLKDPESNSCPTVVQPCFPSIPLPTPVQKVTPVASGGTPHYSGVGGGGGGGGGGSYTPHQSPKAPEPIYVCVNEPTSNSAGKGGGGGGTPPIVLDLNRNGVTSISLAASSALFDYDADDIKENTAWIENSDALLVNDINHDGLINNATELFGNYTRNSDGSIAKSGYQALSYYDTNSDGVVDATDTRFNELKLWIDSNQDGATDIGELKTLSEMGVTSLTLNSATPYIATTENTNTIIQETTFTDAQGEGVMRDVLFRYENTSSTAEGVYFDMDANGIKEKMITWTDPNEWMVVKDINGDGKINNGSEIVGNNMILNMGTTAADTIQALKTFDINHDGVVDTADNSGLAFWTDRNHNGLTDVGELEALGAAGAIQVIKLNPYQTLLSMYEEGGDGVINSSDNLSYYIYIQTNSDGSITLYLPDSDIARDMIAGYTGGESIQTAQGEKIIKTIQFYSGFEIKLNDTAEGTDASETLEGSSRSETFRGKGGRDILDAGAGDDVLEGGTHSDKLMGGEGDDTYVFNRGDGKDLIIDSAGSDTISFAAGITRDDLIIKSNGIDISIYLKDGTKPLTQLTDQIIIKDWHTTGMVENIAFSDGSIMDVRDMIASFGSDKNDTIYGTENSETLIGGKGNDVLQGRGGSDTYLFGRGDGKDTIIETGGVDTLEFAQGISKNDLIVKKYSNDIIIGVKESGVIFDNLSDVITLKNWYTAANRIERFSFSDEPSVNESWIMEMLDNVDDVIYGTDESEVFSTFGGNDTVYAEAGDDTLIGGKGDDILNGGIDNDTYVFGRGDGKDTIQEATLGMIAVQGNDTLKFSEGITTADVIIKQIGNDLVVGLKEEGKSFDQLNDVVTIKNWSSNTTRRMLGLADYYKVENFVFSDGTIWNQAEIVSHIGTDQDDLIYGSETKDVLQGGKGNDSIYGLTGDDTYVFNRGDGRDIIYDTAQNYYSGAEYNSGNDVLKFGEGIAADDLIIQKSGTNLIVAIKENGMTFEALQDRVILNNWFLVNNRIETFMFGDGSTMDTAFLLDGTDGDDYLTFGLENNTVYLSSGNDIIYAGAGNDILFGETGNDKLYGEAGNDALDGGFGDDKLYGGFGDDIYIFGRGYGKDVVEDGVILSGSVYSGGTNDTLKFTSGITPEDIIMIQSGHDLVVGIREEGKTFDQLNDVITLINWSRNTNDIEAMNGSLFERYGIENFSFSNGTNWKVTDIISHIGTDGNDIIYGLDSADTLHGGKGDDILYGRRGNDTYLFNRGDGKDIVSDTNWQNSSAGNDTLKFGEGIAQVDLIFKRVNTDLVVGLKEEGVEFEYLTDKVTLTGWYNFNTRIETFMLSDGSIMDTAFLDTASEQDDYLLRGAENDSIDALGGNDTIYAGAGNDTLIGGTGNDTLYGEIGDDTLDGGIGNDTLYGGKGNDTYHFGKGDGRDIFDDFSNYTGGGNDTLKFKEGISKDDILMKQIGNNLVVGIKEEGKTFDELMDKITIINWSDNRSDLPESWSSYGEGRIENFIFSDGTTWSTDDIVAHIGTSENDAIYGLDGADTLHGGKGDDSLYGTGGDDTYLFNRGDGRDVVYDANYTNNAGNDTLKFGEGITVDDLIVQVSTNGNDFVVGLKENAKPFSELSDTVTLRNWNNVNNRIENIVFFDGTILDVNDIVKLQQSNGDDIITGTEQNNTFEAGLGNDIIYGGAGNDTYVFNRGDGIDNVNDLSGKIYVRFGAGITPNDIILHAVEKNLMIALAEEGKTFSELSDKIILVNGGMNLDSIIFDDGKVLNSADIINLQASSISETIFGTSNNDTIEGLTGDDTIYGGNGNDVYIYKLGDGKDIINDDAGNDTLQFGEGITQNDLIIKAFSDNNDLIIALKEEGKTFSELSNKITIKDWFNTVNRIENITFSDGSMIAVSTLIPRQGTDGDDTTHLLDAYSSVTLDLKEGNDILTTGGGHDTLIGGKGNDLLSGGLGDDTYVFNRGDGHDTIDENNYTYYYIGANDTLKFGEGITQNDLIMKVSANNNDLIIALKEDTKTFSNLSDSITMKDWFNPIKRIETISFSDGSSISTSTLISLQGTNENDTTHLLDATSSVTLDLKEGNDTLTTGSGNDTLIGGQGNDTLSGGAGNDTYIFNKGDGRDTVFDTSGNDTISFGEGITKDNLVIRAIGTNLILGLKEEGVAFEDLSDKVTLVDWYKTANSIENFLFSDGTILGADIAAEFIGTDAADSITASDNNEIIMGMGGNDTIMALAGDDTLIGGKGNDILQGGAGNDTYVFNRADGTDTISDTAGTDTLQFGEGITSGDLIIQTPLNSNDLIVAIKEDGKSFGDLSDKLVLKDWFLADKRIEQFMFSDGSVLEYQGIIDLSGDEILIGTVNNDTINGYSGNDTLEGKKGNDTLDGGPGNDFLQGGYGDDTYLFGRGDGKDTIIDTYESYNWVSAGRDILRFKAGITTNDVLIKQIGNDLVVALKEERKTFDELSDKVIITNWSYNASNYPESWVGYNSVYAVEYIIFADGTSWNTAKIIEHIGTNEDDVIYGLDGADTLIGAKGNDTLYGRGGDDTYVFNRGDGSDTIYDSNYYDYYDGGNDTLKLGGGITADDVIIQKSALNVIVALKEEGVLFENLTDKITLLNWVMPNNRIEHLLLSDGSEMALSYLLNSSEDDDYLVYGSEDDNIEALSGDDEVHTNDGNDTITGGLGNDTLYGGYGNDTYIFNRGDGQDWISDDDSSYIGNLNIDTIRFGEGITKEDLIATTTWTPDANLGRANKTLIIALKEEGVAFEDLKDTLTIVNWDYQTIERIELSDGTFLSTDDIIGLQSTRQDDIIIGTNYDDVLNGGAGNDTLYGFDSNDRLIGGTGNDTLNGGYGNDTYVFNRGDGQDSIYDDGSSYYGGEGTIGDPLEDILEFGDGILIDNIVVEIRDGDLLIGLKEEGKTLDEFSDIIRISNWEANYYSNAIETIKLADGTTYNIAEYFNLSHNENYYTQASPIVLDLNANTQTSTSIENNNVYFDYNADGLRERTGWIERGDALLAVDLNHDGAINDGSELFGDHTKLLNGTLAADGYEAMKQYDSNNDGKIDASDVKFNNLLLWKDTNLDGLSSTDELSTLAENGIVSIDLAPNATNVAENGNRISYETSFSMASGVNGVVRDLWFKTAGDDTIASTTGEMAETGSFSDSFDDFTTDTTLEIDSIKSFADSGIGSLTLQSRYTGSGLDGASAQTVFEGVGYTGTLSNVWLKSDTLDTQYTYNGTLSDDIKALPSIDGQGNVINLQEAMNEKSGLASSVTEFQNLSETGNLADFEANIDAIIEGWALYDLSGESVNSTPPIVLDLDGDGVTSTSLGTSNAYFDYDGDGRREHTAWSDAGDALLAVDLDNDGVITHGAELFGNHTIKADGTKATDGYDAMAQYDTNSDSVLDASDTEFSKLKLWKDLNQNGKNDAGELSTLTENGISAINLSRTDGTTFTQITEAGNTITNETNYTASSGEGAVRDVWFSYDGTDTIAYSNLSDSDEKKIAIVENFYGRRLNSEERNSVEVIAEVLNQYNALRYDTIAKIITDKLYGEGFPNCQFLHDALNNTLGRVVGGVATATETLLAVNLLGALLKREHVGVLADIYPEHFSHPTIAGLLAQSNIAIGFEEGALIGHIGNRYFGTQSAETLDFSALDGVRAYMSGGDDVIIGTNGIDELVGGEGNDTLDGKSGNDVLEGGQGDDTIKGASTQNVYRYAWGDGNDTIIDAGSDEYSPDTLRLSDLDISRVSIERIGDDMIIHVRDEEGALLTPFDEPFGTITIKEGYASGKIEHFYFKDQRYTFDEVLAYVPANTDYYFVQGDAHVSIDEKGGEDTLHFGEGITQDNIIARIIGNDLIVGLAQEGKAFNDLSDRITILNYTDAIEHFIFEDGSTMDLDSMIAFAQAHLMINGSDESDILYGTAEGETFNGAGGDDTIYGEAGNDTYKFGLGDGSDTIVDTAGEDTIILKEGVLASAVTLSLEGEDLLVSLDDGSRMRIVSWISSEGRIEHIKDTQGVSVDFSAVLKPVVENTTLDGDEDTLFEGSLSVTDISGTALVYTITTDAEHGTFALDTASGEWIYEPNTDFNGGDSVVVSVTNGYGVTSTSTITLNVAGVNDTPIIEGENIAVTLRNALISEGQIIAHDVDGDTITYSIEAQASHGTLSVDEQGRWSYTTIDGYDGQDSAVIRVGDGNGGSMDKTLNFTIIDNTAPDASIETSNTLQDIRILTGEVGATDIDGDVLTYAISTAAEHGTLTIDENGTWNYAATAGYMGTDSAIVTIDDNNGGIITQTLNFDVKVSAPSLANATVNLFEDTSSTGTFNVTNPIGGALVYEVLNASSKGVFALDEQGSWSYNPNTNLNGEDSVTIKVTNAYGLSTITTLNFAIEAVNDAPVTSEQENYILQDVRLMNGVIEASDIDGDTLEYTVQTAPLHGDISVNAQGEWSYTPTELYMGEDSTIISISDGKGGLVTKTITFDNRVSRPSVILDSLTLSEDTPRIESIGVINPIGGVLSFEVVGSPQNGTIRVDAQGVLEYTPSINYHGSDSVTMKVTNIYGLSDTRTIALDILSVNDNPEAPAEVSNILQDIRILSGEVGATDIDGDILTYTVSSEASHGVLTVDENGIWNYVATEGYMGTDSAVITINDNNGGVIEQTVVFDVKVSTPTLADATSNLLEDNTLNGAFNVVNPIGGVLTYEVLTATTNGDFTVDVDGNWSYNPSQDYNGTDSVLVKVTNEYGLSTTATLNLGIEAVNDTPVTTAEASFTLQDVREQTGAVEASDVDADTLTYSVTTAAQHGTVTIDETGAWSYAATEGYMGIDTAIITVDDGNGGTATQTLTFDLKVSAPHLDDVNAMMLEDSSITGTLNVLNPIGGALSYEIISASTKGNFTVNAAGECVYTPAANANGNDSIIVKVTNAYGLSTTAILNVAIEAVNDAPIVAAPVSLIAMNEDSGVITITKAQLLANASDVDGDTLDVTNLTASAGVLVNNNNGTWSLTPSANYNGTINLNYTVTDGQLSVTATAAQVVLSVNDAPVLIQTPTAVTLNAGASTSGTILAFDIDGDVLSYSVTTAPAHGSLSINAAGVWNYTAERYYAGQTSATVNVNDGHGGSVATTLNFTNLMTPDWQYTYTGETMTINDSNGIDALMMSGTSMADLTFLQEGNSLRIDVKDKNDVFLTDYFSSSAKGIETIQAKEGKISLIKEKIGATSKLISTLWGSAKADLISGSDSSETIYAKKGNDILFGNSGADTIYGDAGNDLLMGGDGDDTLTGGADDDILYGDNGNDALNGSIGNDKLFGGIGNDTLRGEDGNDFLNGGKGSNYLYGGAGNDTYLFTKETNTTTIGDEAPLSFSLGSFGQWITKDGGNDTIRFGEGITKNDISFLMSGHNLKLQYGTSALVTVQNQDANYTKIEKFELSDGSYMTNTDMDKIIQQLTAYKADNGISITNNDQLRQNQAMMNIVASGWHQ